MNEQLAPWNSLLLLITGVVSFLGFQNHRIEQRFIFDPEAVLAGKEYHRLVSSAFLHAGWEHLLLNLISIYVFGSLIEWRCGPSQFLLIYFGSVLGGSLLSLYVHRRHEYRAYGASGGACGVIFAVILLFPGIRVAPLFINAFLVPGWAYAIGFMLFSFYGLRRNRDNIGHDAHLGGAIVGLLVAAALHPQAVRANWPVFLLLLSGALLILVYLWFNSLMLPLAAFLPRRRSTKARLHEHHPQAMEVNAILEKIADKGFQSLSGKERALLEEVSGKYRRREQSNKPDSGLTI